MLKQLQDKLCQEDESDFFYLDSNLVTTHFQKEKFFTYNFIIPLLDNVILSQFHNFILYFLNLSQLYQKVRSV